jgi:hypothetical protein
MNTGMQDAFNLAWKLALVFRNSCDEHLLDSYSPERSAVGDEVLKLAAMLTNVGTMKNPLRPDLAECCRPPDARPLPGPACICRYDDGSHHRLSQEPAKRALSGRRRSKAGPAGRTSIGPSAGWRRHCAAFCSFRGEHHRHGRSCEKIPRAAGSRRSPTFPRWRHLAGST